jgi:para-nitrobenzyl esterase
MKAMSLFALAGAALLALPDFRVAAEAVPRVETRAGALEGRRDERTVSFLGVPYATPPVGPLRWRAPRPTASWSGTRAATHPAPRCPEGAAQPGVEASEDCLYLNIVAPAAHSGAPRPVMVWLHGGGFSAGSGSDYDPTRLVSEGDVIVVTTDHRLGIFGLFAYPELAGSGTFMLQDQQAALRWVRHNIAAFGGDPQNITLFGESGGAIATCGHLTSPASRELFDKAILQSGSCDTSAPRNGSALGAPEVSWWQPRETVEQVGLRTAAALGCGEAETEAPLACLRDKSSDDLLTHNGDFISAAYDTLALPDHPARALHAGRFHHVPVMTGHTRDEWRLIAAILEAINYASGLPPNQTISAEQYPTLLDDSFGTAADRVALTYPLERYLDPASAFAAVMTDRMFVCPQLATGRALARQVRTYAYEFADADAPPLVMAPLPPGFVPGAGHASELSYLFDMDTPGLSGENSQQLARDMRGYWAAFAHDGNPNGGDRPVWPGGTFDFVLTPSADTAKVIDSEAEHHCDLWSTVAI